jgi:hypothetical protein
MDRRAG